MHLSLMKKANGGFLKEDIMFIIMKIEGISIQGGTCKQYIIIQEQKNFIKWRYK